MAPTNRIRVDGLLAPTAPPALAAALAAATGTGTVTFPGALKHSGAVAVATVADPDYLPLVVDPDTAALEIVWLTDYIAGGTTGTILRAQEGTTGATHATGAAVVHGPTVADTAAPVDFNAGVVLEANTPNDLATATADYIQATIAPFDTTYDADFNSSLADPDVLPAGLGLDWQTDAATGDLVATEDGLWRVGAFVTFATDATARGELYIGTGAAPVGPTLHEAPDLTSGDDYARSATASIVMRLRTGDTFHFSARAWGATASAPAALVTYASISLHRIG